jgi:hypothetical protein
MPHFTRLTNLTVHVRDALEWCLRKCLAPQSPFISWTTNILRQERSLDNSHSEGMSDPGYGFHGFAKYVCRLHNTLSQYGPFSPNVTAVLNELWAFSPCPHVEVVEEGVWGYPTVSVKTHLKSTFADAVANIKATGRVLSPKDEHYLRLILTHPCGWSATYPSQVNSHWASFFKTSYPHLKELRLILDTMTYAEELKALPPGIRPERASFFLLSTPELYYVYDCSQSPAGAGYGLNRAGETLEEVYLGMKEYKYLDSDDDYWECEEEIVTLSIEEYFPLYPRNEQGLFCKYK